MCRWLCVVVVAASWAEPARAYELTDDLQAYGYLQLWATALEQVAEVRGWRQSPSGEHAADTATGFSVNRARVGTEVRLLDGFLQVGGLLKVERSVEPLDMWFRVSPWRALGVMAGQFRVPSSWENMDDDRGLDFLHRSQLANAVADYALSRAFYTAAQNAGNRSYGRDLGVALLGTVDLGPVPLRYRLMAGNGLGANLWVGGGSNRQHALTNPQQLYYGGRVEVEPVPGWLSLGAHGSTNRHDNMALGGSRMVLDLRRESWSADVRLRVPPLGVRFTAAAGGGKIRDDYYGDGRDDLRYVGGEARAVWRVSSVLREVLPWRVPTGHDVDLGLRYDVLSTEVDESGSPTRHHQWTAGMAWTWRTLLKAQLNWVARRTVDPAQPDLDDDVVALSLQAAL
jgi:hypothetical protein